VLNDPSRLQLLEGLGNFEEAAKNADAAVVYYAGHGAMIDGVNYLLPKDALATNKTALTGTAVESSKLGEALVGAKAVRLVILDACRNNPTATRSLGGNTRGLVRETGPSSTQVVTLMAAGPGEVAQDGNGANSPFATALTQGMTRPGMTVGELPSYVQAEVARMTENEQTPDLQGIWPDVHWTFDPAGPAKTQVAGGADAGATLAKIKWEKDQVFWQTIKDSDDPADFQAYMDAQDRGEITGSFRKLAQNRIGAIKKLPPGSFQVATRSAAPAQSLVDGAREEFARGDYKAAYRDWTTAAGQGNGAAMYNLGVMSLTGKGASKDITAAAKWFKASADTGASPRPLPKNASSGQSTAGSASSSHQMRTRAARSVSSVNVPAGRKVTFVKSPGPVRVVSSGTASPASPPTSGIRPTEAAETGAAGSHEATLSLAGNVSYCAL